jgi:hypothetical protein
MARMLYYVNPEGSSWRVVGAGGWWDHPTREAARRRALVYANCQWQVCRQPASALIWREDGQGYERHDFGEDEEATGYSCMDRIPRDDGRPR